MTSIRLSVVHQGRQASRRKPGWRHMAQHSPYSSLLYRKSPFPSLRAHDSVTRNEENRTPGWYSLFLPRFRPIFTSPLPDGEDTLGSYVTCIIVVVSSLDASLTMRGPPSVPRLHRPRQHSGSVAGTTTTVNSDHNAQPRRCRRAVFHWRSKNVASVLAAAGRE